MTTHLLNDEAFRRTFGEKMVRVQSEGDAPFPFWHYVDAIPIDDYQGYDCSAGRVSLVWRSDDGKFEHVLIDAQQDNDVFMVVVLDLIQKEVVGHRILDLKREYGLRDDQNAQQPVEATADPPSS